MADAHAGTDATSRHDLLISWQVSRGLARNAPQVVKLMTDILLFLTIVAFFAVCVAYTRGLDRI